MKKRQRSLKVSLKGTVYPFYVDADRDTAFLLQCKQFSFEETKNPVYALEAFLIADNANLPLRFWATDWVANAFRKYHASLGKESLEKLLGFKKGRGLDKVFKEVLIRDRNDMLLGDMARVRAFYGVTVSDAAYMVFRREEKIPDTEWNKTSIKIKKISDRSLQDLYNSSPWCEEWRREIEKSQPTVERKKKYLEMFPEDSIPPGVKSRLK